MFAEVRETSVWGAASSAVVKATFMFFSPFGSFVRMRRDIIWMVKCIFEQMNASVKAVTLPKKKGKKRHRARLWMAIGPIRIGGSVRVPESNQKSVWVKI
jgi:hypothetical protein